MYAYIISQKSKQQLIQTFQNETNHAHVTVQCANHVTVQSRHMKISVLFRENTIAVNSIYLGIFALYSNVMSVYQQEIFNP